MPEAGKDVPDLWRDPGGTWVAVGGRAEVLLVSLDALGGRPEPVRFTALTEPWLKGKAALAAPTGGPSLAHFAALFQAWGEERMQAWLRDLERNQVQVLADDDAVRQAVVDGRAIVGILSSDEAAKAAASAARVEVVYPNQRSIGTFVWPTALSVPKSSSRIDEARKLAERLADRSTEQLLVARAPGFLPLRPGIPVPPGITSASNLVVISVDPARIVGEIARRKAQLADWTERMQKGPGTSSR
jgi:iron(III) transport system substrate-binding protein